MQQALDYHPGGSKPPRGMRLLAIVALCAPLVLAGFVYVEYAMAWIALKHPPRPSLDDPKGIGGSSWMHGISAIGILGSVPLAIIAAVLNVAYLRVWRPTPGRVTLHVALLITLWAGLFIAFAADPGDVLYWWFD